MTETYHPDLNKFFPDFLAFNHDFPSFVCLWFTRNTKPIAAAFIQQRTEKRSVFYVLPFDIEMILIATASCSMFIFSRLCIVIVLFLLLLLLLSTFVLVMKWREN